MNARLKVYSLLAALAVTAAAASSVRAEDISAISQLEPIAGSAALIVQHGEGNSAYVSQKYVASGAGGRNHAIQVQAGTGNSASITQEGSDHVALQTQAGSDNSSVIEQDGAGRAAAHIQIGDGHSATITQFGGTGEGGGVTVTQFNLGAGWR